MCRNTSLFLGALTVILVAAGLTVTVNRNGDVSLLKKPKEAPISKAQTLFQQRLREGMDMGRGPCLSNDLNPGWVVDVVHNPREAVDDLPENQCAAYLEGRASHFIELDLEGNVVRIK